MEVYRLAKYSLHNIGLIYWELGRKAHEKQCFRVNMKIPCLVVILVKYEYIIESWTKKTRHEEEWASMLTYWANLTLSGSAVTLSFNKSPQSFQVWQIILENKCDQTSKQSTIDWQTKQHKREQQCFKFLLTISFLCSQDDTIFQSMLLLLQWHSKFCRFTSGGKLVSKPKVNKANRTNDPIILLGQAAGGR